MTKNGSAESDRQPRMVVVKNREKTAGGRKCNDVESVSNPSNLYVLPHEFAGTIARLRTVVPKYDAYQVQDDNVESYGNLLPLGFLLHK